MGGFSRLFIYRPVLALVISIVIVLIGILAAVMGPRLADRRAFDTRGFHDELFSALRFAQKLAIATQCEVGVDINSGLANGYALYFPDDADGDPATCDGAAAGFNGAGFDLWLRQDASANLVFSPMSIGHALLMARSFVTLIAGRFD